MQLNDLQISLGNWHTGLTQANHLSNFFLTEPALASEVVTRVYNKFINDSQRYSRWRNIVSNPVGTANR